MLPVLTRPTARRLSFVIEPFTLHAFSLRDIKPYRPGEIDEIAKENDVRRVLIEGHWRRLTTLHLHEAADRILADIAGDEELSAVDFSGSSFLDSFGLFTMIGTDIRGLPKDAPRELELSIRRAAADSVRGSIVRTSAVQATSDPAADRQPIEIPPIESTDVILAGSDHEELFVQILGQARYRLIVHSTFLSCAAFGKLQNEFRRAAKRGVKIDIFWGAARDQATTERNLNEAIAINHLLHADPHLRGRARVHMSSTRSHAKLIVADVGNAQRFIAVVGSCNWLSSGFFRVESSVVLRHPLAVSRVAQEFAEVIFVALPTSTVAGDLNRLARDLRKVPAPTGHARVQIVTGDMHGSLIRHARDTALERIIVGGDRLGLAAEARTLIPLIAAAERSVSGLICYSRPSQPVGREDEKTLAKEALAANVRMMRVPDRELHGKFLIWDNDNIVVSSLNWSSADTSHDFPHGEIGVHLTSPGVAGDVAKRLTEIWPAMLETRRT
jgi:cardiolipin synthase A/B